MKPTLGLAAALTLSACAAPVAPPPAATPAPASAYLDSTGRDDVLTGGVKRIPIATPRGTFQVWTKRIGNNPKIKDLLRRPGQVHQGRRPGKVLS